MFARVEKLKYRNYPKNSNSRKGSSKSWKLLISPQSSKPTLLEGEYPIQNLRGHHLFPLGQVSASEATGHPLATPLNRIESKTGAAGGERPGGGGRGGVIRGATVGNRGHEGAERERGRGKDEEGSCSRSSKSKSIESISLSSPYFFLSLSLSNHDSRDDRWCGYHEGTSWRHLSSLPSFILHPANDTFSTQLSLASVISYSSGHLSDWKIVSRRSFNRKRSFVSFRSLKILEEKRKKRRKFQLASSRGGKKLAPKSGLVTWIMTRVGGGK